MFEGNVINGDVNDSKYIEIARALADKYEVIYYVNIVTNEYEEYSASMEYARLKISTMGADFFAEAQENMKRDIYPEDYPMMAAAIRKEVVLKGIEETGKFYLSYRLMLDGHPQYVTLSVARAEESSDYIIFAVANVDADKRKELDFKGYVGDALELANRDSLTGAGNKRAFVQKEMELDRRISDKSQQEFAIIISDINDLRKINDSYGHSVGDDFIKIAYNSISEIFSDSKVYRYGGDEFVVILEDKAYDDRHTKLDKLREIQKENFINGKPTLSFGMSEYDPNNDIRTQDVFERADKVMTANKADIRSDTEILRGMDTGNHEDTQVVNTGLVKFYLQFSRLVSAITSFEKLDIELVEKLVIDISKMFRLSKSYARVYKSPAEEAGGSGETIIGYDSGIDGEEIMTVRIVSSVQSIVSIHAYMAPYEEPLNEEKRWLLNLVMRTMVSFISRNRLRNRVEELTFYDENGYKNLRSFYKYIMDEKENMGGKAALRYNLRHFTLVNQELGMKVGDNVIKTHFETLSNIIGDEGIVCRLGGDNFVAICGERQIGNVLNYLTETPVVYEPHEGKCVNVATSTGVLRMPHDYVVKDIGDIMSKVIPAYQTAQTGGKERIVFYDVSIMKDKERSMKVQQLFPEALRNEEFAVYYQPKVNIKTGELIGAEALCRWIHNGEVISPAQFIPMLEETDDICKLDFYVLDHVCRDIRRWMEQGKHVVRISVNLSRKHMMNRNLLQSILKIIDRHEIPHSLIEVELTETTTDVEFSDLKRVVSGLQSFGIYTAVDDFGVGYSSLNLLRELPWNVIKIDRSFLPTEKDEDDSSRNTMFKYVVAMARELGMECIVEGVETEQQLSMLIDNSCDFAQGFMYDKPLPKMEFEDRINKRFYQI